MNVRTLTMLLAVICCCIAAPLAAQNNGRPANQAIIDLGAAPEQMDLAAKSLLPNRRGIFAGIDLNTYSVIISGREYKGSVHEIPVFIGQQAKPLYELSPNSPVRFHVDAEGVLRAVWVDGELQE